METQRKWPGKLKQTHPLVNVAQWNSIKPVLWVIIEAGRALRVCDLVPIGLLRFQENVHNLPAPLNLPTKVGIQMQIRQRLASERERVTFPEVCVCACVCMCEGRMWRLKRGPITPSTVWNAFFMIISSRRLLLSFVTPCRHNFAPSNLGRWPSQQLINFRPKYVCWQFPHTHSALGCNWDVDGEATAGLLCKWKALI